MTSETLALWAGVVAAGLWHGVNPGMGWPLAVSAALMGRGRRDLLAALGPLALGHLLAMLAVLLPFALVSALASHAREIRLAAGALVVGGGLLLLLRRGRHPRALARIPPSRLALWSFAVALAHGAGLMLLPLWLGLCGPAGAGAPGAALAADASAALLVGLVHTAAMIGVGGLLALLVHGWLGLGFLKSAWLDLEAVWAGSLVLVGLAALATA